MIVHCFDNNSRKKKILKIGGGIAAILVGLGIILFAILGGPLLRLKNDINAVDTQARKTMDAAKQQDLNQVNENLKLLREDLLKTQKSLSYFSFAQSWPRVGTYYKDGQHIIQAGLYGVEAGDVAVAALTPYADVLGLKGQGTFAGGTTEERIKIALQTFEKVMPMADDLGGKLSLIQKEIDQVDPSIYPETFMGKPVRFQLTQVVDGVREAQRLFVDYRPVLTVAPSVLGQPDQKTYMLILQNDKELRPTGGFMTAYAWLNVKQGKFEVAGSDDIYKLDASRRGTIPAPEPIRTYLPSVDGKMTTVWQMRDSNLSPDFAVSMKQFDEFYKQVPGGRKYDGIIAIDTTVLLEMLKILGPVEVPQYKLTFRPDIEPRCNCPQAIYLLEDQISRPVGYERDQRKELLGFLMQAMKVKIMSAPKQYWQPLFATFLKSSQEKHIQLYLKDPKSQEALEKINFAGRVREFNGDYFMLVDTNFAGAKSNLYIEQRVDQSYEVDANGTVKKTVTINYKNPQRADGFLNGEYRNWMRIYVPKGSKIVSQSGTQGGLKEKEDLGKTVFEGFVTVRPEGAAQVTVSYTLPEKADKSKGLPLLVQKQAGLPGFDYRIKVNTKEVKRFQLLTDTEFSVPL